MGRTFVLWNVRLLVLRKVLAVVLSVSFALSPLAAYAQDAGTDKPPADTGSDTAPAVEPPAPSTPELSIPGVDMTSGQSDAGTTPDVTSDAGSEAPTTPTDDAAPADAEKAPPETPNLLDTITDPAPTITSQGIFTFQNGKPKADGATGALVQTIKLDIPPGRNGVQPDLALQYNSQKTEDSIVGYGWTVNIPYIQRLNKMGSQDLYNKSYFSSSIDGELATTSTTTTTAYGARVDDGSFNAYSFVSNVWTMYDKNGTRYTFGASDNAQQNASASSTKIYKWMLQEIRDTNNNYARYIYTKDSGQIYPRPFCTRAMVVLTEASPLIL